MKKILLPTDFSENSWNAISYAVQLYKDQKCNFILLHTYTPVFYQFEYMEPSTRALMTSEAIKETSKRKLDELLHRIKKEFNNPNHTFTQILSFNTLTEEIKALLEGSVMDLIIMGTKGASGLKEVLLGSNTVHILNSVKCPIIAVPDHFTYETPGEILFPSDYMASFDNGLLETIRDITVLHHSRLNILHVFYGNNLTEEQQRNKQFLEDYFKVQAPLFHDVDNQNVTDAIANFQLKNKINLLVMVNNKHSFFENIFFRNKINQIGFHLNIPFLVIPSKL